MYVYGTLLNVRFLVKLGIVGNSSFGQSLLAVLLFKMGTEPWGLVWLCGCAGPILTCHSASSECFAILISCGSWHMLFLYEELVANVVGF